MANQILILPDDSGNTGKKLDTSELTVGANTAQRERMNIADPTTAAAIAGVVAAVPSATSSDYGAEVRTVGTNLDRAFDGTNQETTLFDEDSGAGTQFVRGVSVRAPASGGSTDIDFNSGNKSAATVRVVLATDQPALTNKLLVTPDANSAVNVAQINGVTPLMGNGVTGTGSPRVTIASDNTAFAVNATLSAETTKVLGVTRTADGAGNLLTSNSSTYTAKFGLDANILGTLGTAFSTAGKVDVKGADGDVFVRQATAANLNCTEASAASALTSLQLIDDPVYTDDTSTHSTGASKVFGIGAAAAPTDTAVNANDIGMVGMTVNRQLYASLEAIAGTTIVTGGVAGSQSVGGTVATNVAITANPLNLGAQGVSSENTVVTTARQVQLVADLVGKLIVLPYANPENFVNGTTGAITDTTSTAAIAAQAAGVRTYVTSVIVTNSHATVGTFVKVLEGTNIICEGYAAALGGGFAMSFPTPLRGATATAINIQPVTTGANVIGSVAGYKGV